MPRAVQAHPEAPPSTVGGLRGLLLAVSLGLAACGGSQPVASDAPSAPAVAESNGELFVKLSLIEDAAETTGYRGTRHSRFERGPHVLDVREDVGADGNGRFALELLDSISLPPEYDSFSFPIAYESAAVFNWRFRSFRVRGVIRLLQNYLVYPDTAAAPVVAGIACERLIVQRHVPFADRPGSYEVDYDPMTGVVLAWREFDASGHAFRTQAFETFTYGGDLSNMTLQSRTHSSTSLDLEMSLEAQVGFPVLEPEVLPFGFHAVTAELMDVSASLLQGRNSFLPAGRWVKFLYTDGVETISFAHSESAPFAFNPGATANGSGGVSPESVIRVLSQGAWETGFGEIDDRALVVMGRMSFDGMELLVGSSL